MNKNEIFRSYGKNYKNMTVRLLEAADLAADIPAKDCRIGLKPNLVTPTPAMFGATTHPEIAAGAVEYLQAHGFHDITILEGSWVGDRTADAFAYCGWNDLAERYGVRLTDTQKDRAVSVDAAGLRLKICESAQTFGFLINLPVVKGHCQTRMTCALKNMKGLIPNTEKRRFHTMGLHKPIAHLNTVLRPDFILADHICGDPDFEEGGNPVVCDCIMAARDPVLLDAFACTLLGLTADDVPYIRMAEALGVGSADLKRLRLRTLEGVPTEHAAGENRLLAVSYAVDEYDSCSACYGSLIPALSRLKEEGLLERLQEKICIGQGHRGTTGILGVGNCTRLFAHSIPGCPPSEEDIYQGLKTYIRTQCG